MKNTNSAKGRTKSTQNKVSGSHITRGNVFEELGFSRNDAMALQIKTDCHSAIMRIVQKEGYTQKDLQKLLDQPQSRVSELMTGKISKMSIEKLLNYLALLGGQARLVVDSTKGAA